MHEFSIAQALVEATSKEALGAGASRVTRITCRVGVLRQVNDWLLREALEIAGRGTVCEGSELCIEKTRMHLTCPQCRIRFPVRDWQWQCPTCGAEGEDPNGGDELELLSIEAEVPDEDRSSQERVRAQ